MNLYSDGVNGSAGHICFLLWPISTKLGAQNTVKFITLQFWRSKVQIWSPWTKGVGKAAFLSGGPRGPSVSLPFPASRGSHVPWLVATFHLKSQQVACYFSLTPCLF